MKTLSFSKMVGAGNDFILVDNRSGVLKTKLKELANKLCQRQLSIGADGLILVEKCKIATVKMRIFNPDGSEAEMCGNGVRCLAKFSYDSKIVKKTKFTVETISGIIDITLKGDVVKAKLVDPKGLNRGIQLSLDDQIQKLSFINTGVPHAVQIVNSLKNVDVQTLGREIRYHDYFAPKGTNVNFVQIDGLNRISIRTYERGVEAETLACGTGSTAGALIAALTNHSKSPIEVKTKSGEILKIHFSRTNEQFYNVYLEGKIKKSFEGRIKL